MNRTPRTTRRTRTRPTTTPRTADPMDRVLEQLAASPDQRVRCWAEDLRNGTRARYIGGELVVDGEKAG